LLNINIWTIIAMVIQDHETISENGSHSHNFFAIIRESLAISEQEKRVRRALGIEHGPLPKVKTEWLRRYYAYLSAHLVLPFGADCPEEVSEYHRIFFPATVVGLLNPDDHEGHEEQGLLCRVSRAFEEVNVPLSDVEVPEDSPNSQLIEDYWYWFWNWRFDPRI
jgi:hypothetical protein